MVAALLGAVRIDDVTAQRLRNGPRDDPAEKQERQYGSNCSNKLDQLFVECPVENAVDQDQHFVRDEGRGLGRHLVNNAGMVTFWWALEATETMTGEHMARGEKGRMRSPATRSVLRPLLLTRQRRSEVVEARKSELELDIDEPVWTIPGECTKNGLLHRLPLCPLAKVEFAKATAASPDDSVYVFASPESEGDEPISPNAVTRAMARLVAEIKIARVSPHDLRRTVGTESARLGLPVHVRSLVLNHSPMSRGVTDGFTIAISMTGTSVHGRRT